MKKTLLVLAALMAFVCTGRARATVWTISSGASQSSMQGTISGASAGDTVQWNAGTYAITGPLTIKCGVTYTATTPAVPSNVILNSPQASSSVGSGNGVFTLTGPCTAASTVIEYLDFNAATTGIFVTTSYNNLTIQYNQFTNIPGGAPGNSPPSVTQTAAMQFWAGCTSTATCSVLSNATITHNQIGDSNSCISPVDVMGDTDSPEDYEGACIGILFSTSINGFTVSYNNFTHVSEGVHLLCAGGNANNCSSTNTPPGPQTYNTTVEYNDFNGIHRIGWEDQAQEITNFSLIGNSLHDWVNPYFASQGFSMACCSDVATVAPFLNVQSNVITFNGSPLPSAYSEWSFGMEGWGLNATYVNNWIGSTNYTVPSNNPIKAKPAIVWGYGPVSSVSYNTACGPPIAGAGYFTAEGLLDNPGPPSQIANVTVLNCTAAVSAAPSISPATGSQSGPITVTITDPGFTGGSLPLGNTSIFYTTDGTSPVPGQGTTQRYTGSFSVAAFPTTVKAVGMWGAPNQPIKYNSDTSGSYGFVPSTVISNNYTSGTPAVATPTFSPASENFTTSLSVSISDATSGSTIYYTTDGTQPTTGSSVYSSPITVTAQTTLVQAIATKSGMSQSLTGSATYVNTAYVATPTFSPASENFTGTLGVSIADATSGASIYYTTDGTTPSTSGGGGSSGATYYLSPTGLDSNSGTSSGSPWLTPNHALNCGDSIIAASGTYSSSNFQNGKWGTVTCGAGNNVAWLTCVTFDTCKISSTSSDAMWVDKSFWGVQGWETTTSVTTDGACFHAGPSGGSSIHHIVFANDVANGCMGGGFNAYKSGSASVDYIAYVGDVAYNAASGSGACYSGLNVYEPIASDSNSGTHIFMAGSFSYNNIDGCSGKTDGEGFNYDTFDLSQGGGTPYAYQAVMENNIAVNNGSDGFLMENNGYSTSTAGAPAFFLNNTSYGNLIDNSESFPIGKGEMYFEAAHGITAQNNLLMTNRATGAGGDPIYAFAVANCNNTISVSGNWLYSAAGNNTVINNCSGFAYGSNFIGTSPAFASITIPGAPSCAGTGNVPACMATMLANFTPTNISAKTYGYQAPVTTPLTDPYFPTWLCNTNLPAGLVSTPCTPTSELYTGSFTIASTTTVKALAAKSGFTTSPIATAVYTVGSSIAATPTFSPASETFSGTVSVSLASATSGATIYYTTNGSTPSATTGGGGGGSIYYLSPSGSDSNSGLTSSLPWLTPNHALNCGDTIIAAASTAYSNSNFASGNWGTVTCSAGNNVAWLRCTAFDACKISVAGGGTNPGMYVDNNYWGVQGFEVAFTGAPSNNGECFLVQPSGSHPTTVHHVIFANNVANGCYYGGFIANSYSTTASVDYFSIIGNIAYNAAQGSSECFSGISVFQPIASDSNAGTHIFVAGNLSYANFDPGTCDGTAPTDGEGATFDTFDNSIGGGAAYLQQAAMENNLFVGNGGRGVVIGNNNIGAGAPIYVEHNTNYGNNSPSGTCAFSGQGEIGVTTAYNVISEYNLDMTAGATGCSGFTIYAFSMNAGNNTDVVQSNWLYSASGNNTFLNSSGSFAYGSNITGTNPGFASTTIPGAPSCSGTASAVACMATSFSSFTPSATGASAYGYQAPVSTPISDALFPTWLCNTNLPGGLISTPCDFSEEYTSPFTLSATTTVQAIATKAGLINSPVGVSTYTTSSTNVATPTFSPASESYTTSVTVTIASATSGATIYYTTNGNTPTTASAVYSAPITITGTSGQVTTVQALAVKSGLSNSSIGAATYSNGVGATAATPTFSPDSETYVTSVVVTLADSTSGSSIYYTTDGSTPSTSSTLYTTPFTVAGGIGLTTTVNAIAVAPGFFNSPVGTATYLNNPLTASTPTFSPDSEDFTTPITVTISETTGGATIYYTRDGTTPTTSSSVYTAPLTIATTTTLKAIAVVPGYVTSAVGQAIYATSGNQSNPPVIIPGPQLFSSSIVASITNAPSNPGATIYYTVDGSQPTTGSTVYHGPIVITTTTILNAIEVYGALQPSLVASCAYTLSSCPGCWWIQ